MSVIFRIALRNLREHKSKTLIVGTIIAVGIMVMTIGTSLIDTATLGIEKNFIENYTGNILIGGIAEDDLSIFGVQSVGGIEPTPQIPEYSRIIDYLDSRDDIEVFTPQISGFASIATENQPDPDARGMTFLFGIEPDSYREMFDKVEISEGAFLEPGETGILLAQSNRERLEKRLEISLEVGDKLRLTGFSDVGIKIREVEIIGFYRLLSETDGINMSSYIDLDTLRALKAMNLGGFSTVVLDERQTNLLEADNFDDLFSSEAYDSSFSDPFGDSFDDNPIGTPVFDFDDPFKGSSADTSSELKSGDPGSLADEQLISNPDAKSGGSFEFILLSLKNPRRTARTVNELNEWFISEGIAAQAMDWKGAAGPFSSTADVVRSVFNVAVLLVAFVALIIITNTLLISIMERKREIGTMRAIGAGKGFVTAMFTSEITVLSLVFGIIGQLAGLGILGIVNLIGIKAGNSLVEILFAGPVLRPVVNLSTLAADLAVVLAIGILANIYPVYVALKIQPVKAISSV
jgi:putative ABC transport system permease protein